MAKIKGGGVEVDGLAESIRALNRIDPALKKEAVQVFRDGAKDIQARAQGRIGNHPGYRFGRQKGMIGRSATSTGAGVKLRATKYPWALAGEFGEKTAHVFGAPKRQAGFRRRTAAPPKPPTSTDMFTNKGGYWIQPTLRKRLPHVSKQISDDLTKVYVKAFKRAGVLARG